MKLRVLVGAACMAGLMTALPVMARPAAYMSYAEMTAKADLVVIARPVSTRDLPERMNLVGVEAVGQETAFAVKAILKGSTPGYDGKAPTEAKGALVVHHYRLANPRQPIVDGPGLASFDLKGKSQYLMFLRRNGDRFEPITSQYDADFSFEKLRFPADD